MRVSELSDLYRRRRSAYRTELEGLAADDFIAMGSTAPLVNLALSVLERADERERVLDKWNLLVEGRPELAILVLHAASVDLPLSRALLDTMLHISRDRSVLATHLAPILGARAVASDHLRHHARRQLEGTFRELEGWERLQADADAEARARAAAWELAKERQRKERANELARIAALPPLERFRELLAKSSLVGLVNDDLANVSREEVFTLPRELRQRLSRRITHDSSAPWQQLKALLVEASALDASRRRQKSLAIRNNEVSAVASLPPLQRLIRIVDSEPRPLDFWPADWAIVDDRTLIDLGEERRKRLVSLIRKQKRRLRRQDAGNVWQNLASRLKVLQE